jgi:hypothetical protein
MPASRSSFLEIWKKNTKRFQTYRTFSQDYAKSSFFDIYSIAIQADKARQIIDISFALNDTVVKIAWAFNARRNTRFLEECCDAEQRRARRAFVSPKKLQNLQKAKSDYLQKKGLSCKSSAAESCPLKLQIRRSYFSPSFVFLPI